MNGWRHHLYILLAAIIILLVIFMSEYLGVPPEQGHETRQYTDRYSQQSSKDAVINVALSESKADKEKGNTKCAECEDVQKSVNEFIKNKRDLTAQEGMWRAANFLVWLAAFQLAVGTIGLVIIHRTLSTTQEATKEAANAALATNRTAKAAENAERAYVFVDFKVGFGQFSEIDENLVTVSKNSFYAIPVIENHGRSPALEVSCEVIRINRDNIVEPRIIKGVPFASHQDGNGMILIDFLATNSPIKDTTGIDHLIDNDTGTHIWQGGNVPTPPLCRYFCHIIFNDIFGTKHWLLTKTTISPVLSNPDNPNILSENLDVRTWIVDSSDTG